MNSPFQRGTGLGLYPSEKKLLIDVALGLTAKQSACKRGVTVLTVNAALRRVRTVLGCTTTTRALVICLDEGVITMDEIREEEGLS